MEQEIEELKAKLLRAEELIQEIQVRGGQGALREEGVAGPCPPASSLTPFPRDVPGTPLPCMAPRSCCLSPGTCLPRWSLSRS